VGIQRFGIEEGGAVVIRIHCDGGWIDHELGHVVAGTEGSLAIQGDEMESGDVVWRFCHAPHGCLMFPWLGFSEEWLAEQAAKVFWEMLDDYARETFLSNDPATVQRADILAAYEMVEDLSDVFVEE
jgi:hypothetical protein